MIAFVRIPEDKDDKERKDYHCSRCGSLITRSTAAIHINGAIMHSFVNPAGMQCNFMTFSQCVNVLADTDLFVQHSWFTGYGWRFLVCGICRRHLGWKYDSVAPGSDPLHFFGVLIDAVEATEKV